MQSESGQITIRHSEVKDEESLAVLLHNNFPNALAPESICKTSEWQFRNEFTKNSGTAVAVANSEIVAHYAVMWLPMVYRQEYIDGAISTASVTDKRYRKRGLFPELAEKVYRDIAKEGCRLVYGFPNSQSSYSIFNKIGWFEVGTFPLHLKILNFAPFIKKVIGDNIFSAICARIANCVLSSIDYGMNLKKPDSSYEIIKVNEITDDIDHIWETTHVAEKIALVRNKKYLTWRYKQKPHFKYDIYAVVLKNGSVQGYFITYISERFGLKTIYVMEILACSDAKNVYSVMVDHLNKMAREISADAISVLLMQSNPIYGYFLRCGFIPVPRKIFPQEIYFGVRPISDKIDHDYATDSRNWYISWGDLDVV
jgi:predicted acetyltransferase